jgi:proteasome lid subunit RPN8/RPN11
VGRGYLPSLMQIFITHNQLETMRKHVEACAPLEACGLLAGKNGFVSEVYTIKNQAQSPVRYRMDPIGQLHAFNQIEAGGLELLGIFHSHPSGPEAPSATDIAESAYSVVQIIWSPSNRQNKEGTIQSSSGWQACGFWIENGKSLEVTLQITEDE